MMLNKMPSFKVYHSFFFTGLNFDVFETNCGRGMHVVWFTLNAWATHFAWLTNDSMTIIVHFDNKKT